MAAADLVPEATAFLGAPVRPATDFGAAFDTDAFVVFAAATAFFALVPVDFLASTGFIFATVLDGGAALPLLVEVATLAAGLPADDPVFAAPALAVAFFTVVVLAMAVDFTAVPVLPAPDLTEAAAPGFLALDVDFLAGAVAVDVGFLGLWAADGAEKPHHRAMPKIVRGPVRIEFLRTRPGYQRYL